MAPWKDHVFEDWWPLGQAMILVRASIRRTARAMKAEGKRLFRLTNAEFDFEWLRRSSIDNLFDSVDRFTIMSSMRFALPTTGKWTVIWNNASRCDGHSSFAHCLAAIQKLETIHFYSSDQNSTQLAGTHFSHYAPVRGEDAVLRDVYCCNQKRA
jgi:hypothetical protein